MTGERRAVRAMHAFSVVSAALIAGAGMLALLGAGCGKDSDKENKGKAAVTWPDKPADGAPAVVKFVRLVEGKRRSARLRVFNFSDKPIRRLDMTLHYRDETGKDLKTFPWSQMGTPLVGPKGHETFKAGAFLPDETRRVEARIGRIRYRDGSEWKRRPAPRTP